MTPAERAVIAAARFCMAEPGQHEGTPGRGKLAAAIRALDAEQPPDGPAEMPLTWGQLVADDEMWSDKARKWFIVLETKAMGEDTQVRLFGGALFKQPSKTPVRVRRSAMGQAVDMFATVLWSGPNGG